MAVCGVRTIETHYATVVTKKLQHGCVDSDQRLSVCRFTPEVYQVCVQSDDYRLDGTRLAAGSTVTYIVEKRTDSWKFRYRSAVDSDLHVADCDAYLNYEYIAMDEAFKASLAGHIG